MKKPDIIALSRKDAFWACERCLPTARQRISGKTTRGDRGDLEARVDNLEKSIDTKIEQVIKRVMNECVKNTVEDTVKENVTKSVTESVSDNMSKLWVDAAAFPALDSEETKNAPVKPKQHPIATVVKKAITEQKEDEKKKEERLRNIIIHRAPESPDGTEHEERKIHERMLVNELLDQIEVTDKPEKIMRLGTYKKEQSRPLKVMFESHAAQQNVMSNLIKLRNASDNLKKLSITYDMSEEEREHLKQIVRVAKEKSAGCPLPPRALLPCR